MLNDWKMWLLVVLLVAIGYVQDVGTHFERASGISRRQNLTLYRQLFGAFAWVTFRWGGILRLLGVAVSFYLYHWTDALLVVIGTFVVSIALWPIANRHAQTICVK